MRGKAPAGAVVTGVVWITPAYAGKSLTTMNEGDLVPGSPPRMRGKVVHALGYRLLKGITPAYAGKS